MFRKFKIITFFFTLVLINLMVVSCNAQNPKVNWTIKDAGLIRAYWVEDGKYIAYLSTGKLGLLDVNGKALWQIKLKDNPDVTDCLKVLTSDGFISKLSVKDGTIIWEKEIHEKNLLIQESVDGFFAISPIPKFDYLKVFSETGTLLWEYTGSYLNPFAVLLEGKVVIGTSYNKSKSVIEIQKIDALKDIKTIMSIKDPYFIEGPKPLISVNKVTKKTLIAVGTAPWWAIISSKGEIILNKKQLPLSKVHFVSPCGLGFAFANITENKIAVVSEKGNLLWIKKISGSIQAITGNPKFVAVSVGNLGYPGKVLLFSKDGIQVGTIEVSLTLNKIEIADSLPLIVGMLDRAQVQLLDFTK